MNRSRQTSTWRTYCRLLGYVRPHGVRFAVGLIAGFLAGGSLFGLLQVSPNVIRPFERGPEAVAATGGAEAGPVADLAARFGVEARDAEGRMTWRFMLLSLIGLPLLVGVRAVASYLNRYYMHWVGSRAVRQLRDDLFAGLQRQSLSFFGRTDVGGLISRCTNDAAQVESIMPSTAADVVRAPVEIVSAVAFVACFSVRHRLFGTVALMFLAFPLCVVPIVMLGHVVRRYARRALEGVAGLVSRMHENFTGIRVVKAFHTEEQERRRFESMNAAYFRSLMRALRAEILMTPLMEGVGLVLVLVFFVTLYARGVMLHQIVPLGLAGVVVYRPVKQLARINANLQKGAAALERIFDLLDTDTSLKEVARPVEIREFRDRARFDHVWFAYGDGPPVLRDICMEIPRGTVVALVGETGTGKTTLANLLARFYDPTEGRVLLDGVDLRDARIASLRRLVGIVTQETILFNDTIARNIAYGTENASAAAVRKAAEKANAHEFIVANPAGYERVVGEKGFVLSGGERQRLAIARAILRDPPILILDEATSALDTVTERLVQEAIARVMEHRTVLAIAHRLSTIRHADQILLLDGGRIVEGGTHQELYAAGGRYRRLCDMQVLDG